MTASSSARLWDVIGGRKWGYALSALFVIPGAAALILNASAGHGALNWGIDFTGGDLFHLRLEHPFTVGQVRDAVDRFAAGESIIQKSDQEVFIRTRPLAEEARPEFLRALEDEFGRITLLRAEEVGPKIGRELRNTAVLAVLVGLALQVVYITYRFKSIRFALTSNAALLHDLLVVTGIFALTRMEVNSSFVAVLLTVVGYSINDTIIVYDRIRENLAKGTREPFERLVNRSVVETLVRSLTTGMAAIMAIAAVYLFGGSTTRDFAFGLLAGIVAGTYSSIFNASALLVDWHSWSGRRGGRPRQSVVAS